MAGFLRQYRMEVHSRAGSSIASAIVTELQVTATFLYNSTSTQASPDTHHIAVTNPSEELLTALREKGTRVIFQAGYVYEDGQQIPPEDLEVIFVGEVVTSKVVRTNSDTIVTLVLSQGYTGLQRGVVSETYPAGSFLSIILSSMIRTTGLVGNIDLGEQMSTQTTHSQTYAGLTSEVLERFCNKYKLRWYMVNETVFVVSGEEKFQAQSAQATNTTINDRIKGTVAWTVEDSSEKGGTSTVQADINMFLLPSLTVGSTLEVELEGATVVLVVDSIKHVLDFYGSHWDTKVIAKSKQKTVTKPLVTTSRLLQDFSTTV